VAVEQQPVLAVADWGATLGALAGRDNLRCGSTAQRLLGWTDPEVCAGRTGLELFAGAVMDLHETAAMLIPERRANPGDDLISWMVQAEFDGKKMTDGIHWPCRFHSRSPHQSPWRQFQSTVPTLLRRAGIRGQTGCSSRAPC
jgi:hypothetical protein